MFRQILCASLLGSMLVVSTQTAQAHQDPAVVVAERCANRVDSIVDRNRDAATDATQECLETIRRLLADGNLDRARRVARRCISAAEDRATASAEAVNDVRQECIRVLLDMGAPTLARRINNYCDDAISELRTILQRQKNAISNAVN